MKRTEYVLDNLDPVAEYFLWNGQRAEYYRGGAEAFSPTPMLLARRHFPAGTLGQTYWYHLDGRGSVAGLTKHLGQSTHNYRYDAYGQLLPAQGNWTDSHNHYTFAGKEWDEHLGLYEFGIRLYDPWAGVWLTREPLPGEAWEPRTWHRYQYAYASPISYYDPYGLQTCGFNILTGERACFGERTGMGWTPTLAAPPLPGGVPTVPTGSQQACAGAYLSPWREQLVKRYAARYGLPWQVVAGLLQSEIQLDTNWKDTVENVVLFSLYVNANLPLWPSSGVSRLALKGVLWVRPNPGPGVGNVHLETARRVSRYFAEQYGGQEELQLNLHDLPREDLAFLLTLEEENIQVVAAYARMLADYRFGAERLPLLQPHLDLSQWTLEDALALWHGYRYGVREVSPPAEKYGFELKDFQTREMDLEELIQLAQGRGKEESLLGAVPYFLCYFQRCD